MYSTKKSSRQNIRLFKRNKFTISVGHILIVWCIFDYKLEKTRHNSRIFSIKKAQLGTSYATVTNTIAMSGDQNVFLAGSRIALNILISFFPLPLREPCFF